MAKTQIIRNEVNQSKKLKTNDDPALAKGGKTTSFGRQAADPVKPGKTGKGATTTDKTAFAHGGPSLPRAVAKAKPHSGGKSVPARGGSDWPAVIRRKRARG